MPKITSLVAIALLMIACQPEVDAPPTPERVDEEAIDDVWHKAKLRGVAFRAIGQEPGWLLEISNGEQILLVTDYGENRIILPYVEPVVFQDERRTEYRLPDHNTIIEIRGEPCTDSMSGERFAVTVSLVLPDTRLDGCGRALF
ncbi:MAG: COG3650 family protein [Gammaproteobacteria bacterium]